MSNYSRILRPTERGTRVKLHGNNLELPMSALGQQRTCRPDIAMSALPPKADIERQTPHVCFGPEADTTANPTYRTCAR
jgi:hypothetical protein